MKVVGFPRLVGINQRFLKAERDLNRAQAGIIVIDEYDKLSARGDKKTNNAQYMYNLQNDLLAFVEGGQFRCWGQIASGKEESVMIDTSGILFLCLGAFEGLGSTSCDHSFFCDCNGVETGNEAEVWKPQLQDFIDFGFRRELMGRIPLRCQVNALTEEDYRQILLDSEDSRLIEMEAFFRFNRNAFLLSNTVVDLVILAASLSGIGDAPLNRFCTMCWICRFFCSATSVIPRLSSMKNSFGQRKLRI